MFPNDFQQMQVQPPGTELPNACMPICAFEICTSTLGFGINVPASAPFIRNQGSVVGIRDLLCKGCIVLNGLEAVLDGKSGSFELSQSFGEIVIGLLREYEFRCSREGHLREAVMQKLVVDVDARLRKLVAEFAVFASVCAVCTSR
jgi:hypothetical protein